MLHLEKELVRLKKLISQSNPCTEDMPVGLTITASGNYYVVKYSLSQGPSFTNLDDAIGHLRAFLNKADEAKKQQNRFVNVFTKILDLRENQKKNFDEIAKELDISQSMVRAHYEVAVLHREHLDHWLFELPTRVRNVILASFGYIDKDEVKQRLRTNTLGAYALGKTLKSVLADYLEKHPD